MAKVIYENRIPIEDDFMGEDYSVMRKRASEAASKLVGKITDRRQVKVELADWRHPMKYGQPPKLRETGFIEGVITAFCDSRGDRRNDPKRAKRIHMASDGRFDGIGALYFDHHSYGPVKTTSDGKQWWFCSEKRGGGIPLHRVQRVTVLPRKK